MKNEIIKKHELYNQADIFLYDEIGNEGISAKEFRLAMAEIPDVERLTMNIHSPGGSIKDGRLMCAELGRFKGFTTANIVGLAGSMGGIVALSCDEIHIAADAYFMLHNPTGGYGLEAAKDFLVDRYVEKTGANRYDLIEMMDAETYLAADEAVEMGFCDHVCAPTGLTSQADHARYRNQPYDMVRKYITTAQSGRAKRLSKVNKKQTEFMRATVQKILNNRHKA